MRSRAELLLKALAMVSLGLLLIRGFFSRGESPAAVESTGPVAPVLREVTRSGAGYLSARFDAAPDRVDRDWLAALRGAGVALSWDAARVAPVSVGASAIAEPIAGVRIVTGGSARAGESIVLADSLGVIDTINVRAGAGSIRLRTTSGRISAVSRGTVAFVEPPPRASLRRVLVLGPAGWESKFVVAALEEAGWEVDARLDVAPGAVVTQGTGLVPDTARHSAVILLDGTGAASGPAVARYVAQGGGAILVGSATRLQTLSAVTPAIAGQPMAARPRSGGRTADSGSALDDLGAMRLLDLRSDAGPLIARGAVPLVAARRAGRGRVVASGLDETWKWRMRPDSGARTAHSEWWSSLVGAVAMTPAVGDGQPRSHGDPAPLAALTMALGPQPGGGAGAAASQGERRWVEVLLYGVFLASILGEVFSRRKRGLA